MKPLEAIILAAGSGRRLGEAARGLPKCLVEVAGRPILHRQMESLREMGVRRFIVVTGYCAGEVEAAAEAAADGATVVTVRNDRYAETNVLTSWLLGSRCLTADHVYAHGDTVFAQALLERLLARGAGEINLAYDRHECGEEEMKVRLSGGALSEISKSMPAAVAAGEFTGVMSVRASVLPSLQQAAERLLGEDGGERLFVEATLQELLNQGRADVFSLVDITGLPWREIDFPEDLIIANRLFAAP